MAPKRKHRSRSPGAEKSKDEEGANMANMDTDEFTEHVRSKINKQLEHSITSSNRMHDLDLAVKTARAIISSNKEIWQRCVESICGPNDNKLVFKRASYTKVEVKTAGPSYYASLRTLSFLAFPEFTQKDFGMPKALPEQLSNIIAPTLDEKGIFADYEKYLETLILLNEDTQLACLCILKKHLEDIQIFLGEIDGWLMAGSFCVDFIVNTFEIDRSAIKPPEASRCQGDNCGADHRRLVCWNCGQTSNCKETKYSARCLSNSQSPYSHSYLHPAHVTLKTCSTEGDHNHTFDITQEAHQDKLKKFLEFVS
jgi:hypothetical protein